MVFGIFLSIALLIHIYLPVIDFSYRLVDVSLHKAEKFNTCEEKLM